LAKKKTRNKASKVKNKSVPLQKDSLKGKLTDSLEKNPSKKLSPASADGQRNKKNPIFLFEDILYESAERWPWPHGNAEQARDILGKLHQLKTQTIQELQKGGHPLKFYDLSDSKCGVQCDHVRAKANERSTMSVGRFRLGGEQRIYFIDDGTHHLRLEFWDPHHQICPSKKKHT